MPQEPQYIVDEQKLRQFHEKLASSGRFTPTNLGTVEEFVSYIGGDPEKLLGFRQTLLNSGKMKPNELGGNDDTFTSIFVKKKDEPDLSTGFDTPSVSQKKPTEIIEVDYPSVPELKLADYDQITDTNGYGDPALMQYNKAFDAVVHDQEFWTKMNAESQKRTNDISNDIANKKAGMSYDTEEKAVKVLGIDVIKSDLKRNQEELEEELNKKYNPTGSRVLSKSIRDQVAEAFTPEFTDNVNKFMADNQTTPYGMLVTDHKLYEQWKKGIGKHTFGETMDNVDRYLQETYRNAVLDNESTYFTQPEKERLMKEFGVSEDEALSMIAQKKEVAQKEHLRANVNKKAWARFELVEEQQRLIADDPVGNYERIYQIEQMLGEDMLYDKDGKRITPPENEEMAAYEATVNERIEALKRSVPNLKGRLRDVHNEYWDIYQNLLRAAERHGKMMVDKQAAAPIGVAFQFTPEDKKQAAYLDDLIRRAKLDVDASGRMLYMNENLAKSEERAILTQEFFDTWASLNKNIFANPRKDRTTPIQETEGFIRVMEEMGVPLEMEELDAADVKGLEFVRNSAYMTDLAVKMWAFNKVAGATGLADAVKAIGSRTGFKVASKLAGSKDEIGFVAKNLGLLTEHAVMAGYEGLQFDIIDGHFATGAMFYGSNKLLESGGKLLAGKGSPATSLLSKNKRFRTLLQIMARSSASMTTSMESVATAQAIVESWINDSQIKTSLEEQWGANSDWEKRVLMNLALSTLMGIPQFAKMSRKGLLPTSNEQITEIQDRLFNEGKYELAREIGNIRSGLMDQSMPEHTAREMFLKYKWLMKNGVKKKEMKRDNAAGTKFDYEFIRDKFNELVGDDIDLYDSILGKGSATAAEAKKRILKKAGIDVEGKTLGAIEETHYKYIHGLMGERRYERKVRKETELEDIRTRKEKLKEISPRVEEALKENSVGEGLTENTEEIAKIKKSKKAERSQLEKDFILSQKDIEPGRAKNRVNQLINEYRNNITKDNQASWDVAEQKMRNVTELADQAIEVMEALGMKGVDKGKEAIRKLRLARNTMNKYIKDGKVVSGKRFETQAAKVRDAVEAFNSEIITQSIDKLIKDNSQYRRRDQKKAMNMSHANGTLLEAANYLLNKRYLENELNAAHSAEVPNPERVAKIEAEIAKNERVLKRVEQVLDSYLRKRDAMEKLEEATTEEFAMEVMEEVNRGVYNKHIYEAIHSALLNAKDRNSVRERKAELRERDRDGAITDQEIAEYQLLNLFDKTTMTKNQLANAALKVQRLIERGKLEHKDRADFKRIRSEAMRGEFIRDIAHKAFDAKTLGIDANTVREIGLLRNAYMSGRMFIESFPTMMEYMMSRKPGRKLLTGAGHAFTDGMIRANVGEQQAISVMMNHTLRGMQDIFGSTKNGEHFFNKFGVGKKNPKIYQFDIMENGSPTAKKWSMGEAMTMYSYMRQLDQARIMEKDFKWDIIKDGKLEGETIKSMEAELERIGGKEAVDWVHFVTEELLPEVWTQVNERYKQDKGIDLEFIDRYFPVFKYNKRGEGVQIVGDPDNPTPLDYIPYATTGSIKKRQGGSKYELKDFNNVMFQYINDALHYVHWQTIVSDMNSTFKDGEVRDILEKRFSKNALKSIDTLIADLAAGHTIRDRQIQWLDSARRAFARAKLGINPTLFPKQMMSVNAYASEMTMGESMKHLAYVAKPDFEVMQMLMNLPQIKMRYRVNDFNRDIAERTRQTDEMLRQGGEDKIALLKGRGLEVLKLKNMRDNQLIATKWGDLTAILIGGQAMYRVKYDGYVKKGYSAKEAKNMALKDFTKATEKTQQSGALHNLSMFQRSGSYGKLLSLFQNTPLQYTRIELGALTNMKQAVKQGDFKKGADAMKTFMVYHFILPELFRAASNGFYLGDEDKTFFNDPMMPVSFILGSLSYVPVLGAGTLNLMQRFNTEHSFGTSQNIISDMLEETDGIMELIADKVAEAGTPGSESLLEIGWEEIAQVINGTASWLGAPTQGLITIGTGMYDYFTDRTDDELALLGYSRSVYQGYMLSKDAGMINRHMPHNGGSFETMLKEFEEQEGEAFIVKNVSRLEREYRMYQKYGFNDPHVNFLYRGLTNSVDEANYLYKLFQAEVRDRATLRQNYTINELRKDMRRGIEKSYPEYIQWVEGLIETGVITEKTYVHLLMMIENPEMYKEIKDFL